MRLKHKRSDSIKQTCRFTYNSHEYGAVILIDINEPFNENELFNEIVKIPGLEIISREVTYQSFGPIETWYRITTSLGTFNYEAVLEGMVDGFKIHSSDKSLMELISNQLRNSKLFRA